MARWRLDCSSGNSFADGCSEPILQKAGLAGGRDSGGKPDPAFFIEHRIVHAGLAVPDRSLPSTARLPWDWFFEDGVAGSRTGIFTSLLMLSTGSRIGTRFELSSGEPYSGPFALTVGWRLSVAISSWRYSFGLAQSHELMTDVALHALRARVGREAGSSPAAIRSVQSPNNSNAR